jgi:Concanavalin A-like lectin/glucanases superfamily
MSITLFFLIPIGMLAVVWALCFVGCTFPTIGYANPYTQVILGETDLVAYWPLNDTTEATAVDLTGHGHNGTYTDPPAYPAFTAGGDTSTAIPNPALALQQPSIVKGDVAISESDDGGINYTPASADFDGYYVSIPWSTQPPVDLTTFTFEAWVQPGWSTSDPPATYLLFDTRTPDFTGFAVYIGNNNNWGVIIGNGAGFTQTDSGQPVVFGFPSYVAVTCDASKTVNVWINPLAVTASPTKQIENSGYAPVDQSAALAFFIGAGVPFVPPRTTDNGTGSPLFPFIGNIQDVALYDGVLSNTDIQSHYMTGFAIP